MKLIINSSSMIPIYEQIVEQIKGMILNGTLQENDILPSVRSLSKDLKISALTVKKAYDSLEQEGPFVAAANQELMKEEQRKEVEADFELAIQKGRRYGMEDKEFREILELILEE